MKVERTVIPDVVVLVPEVHEDERGFLFESYNQDSFREATGLDVRFVQDNHVRSRKGVLRGMHYQVERPQGKLIRVVSGEIFDVAVDLREGSPTYKEWVGQTLTSKNRHQMWIPPGFAHGYLTLSESAEVLYKITDFRYPEHERVLSWDDAEIGVEWPLEGAEPLLSGRDVAR